MSRTTLLSLAQALGVSRTTVSNAYSRPEKLSAELRERIFATARELGYEGPSPLAASLRKGRTDSIGVLFTDDLGYAFSDPVSTLFLAGVAGQLQEAGHALTVLSAPRSGGSGPMSRAMVDGLIVYSVDEDSPGLAVARKRAIPSVLVDQAPETGTACVNVDDRVGAEAAVAHLAAQGHAAIAGVAVAAGDSGAAAEQCVLVGNNATSRSYVVRERMVGWRHGCEDAGVPPPVMVSCPANDAEHGRHAARLLLEAVPRPTALVCLSDELALGVMAELAAQDLRVPADVSVVGFDDSPAAAMAQPPLTTVRQPARDKGALAAQLLLDRLRTGEAGSSQLLATELVVRSSTAAPAADAATRPADPSRSRKGRRHAGRSDR
ncbi:LacI family DNA-binding transcriptional regulator [Actinopolymorpha sp. B11F2]|uniref:LacI family DNA-binding transcriptional regulator n=1 Tax=Actinopolymorpha sp. B11F2 TaxID=3160862 RepID=UPI0032E4D20D